MFTHIQRGFKVWPVMFTWSFSHQTTRGYHRIHTIMLSFYSTPKSKLNLAYGKALFLSEIPFMEVSGGGGDPLCFS